MSVDDSAASLARATAVRGSPGNRSGTKHVGTSNLRAATRNGVGAAERWKVATVIEAREHRRVASNCRAGPVSRLPSITANTRRREMTSPTARESPDPWTAPSMLALTKATRSGAPIGAHPCGSICDVGVRGPEDRLDRLLSESPSPPRPPESPQRQPFDFHEQVDRPRIAADAYSAQVKEVRRTGNVAAVGRKHRPIPRLPNQLLNSRTGIRFLPEWQREECHRPADDLFEISFAFQQLSEDCLVVALGEVHVVDSVRPDLEAACCELTYIPLMQVFEDPWGSFIVRELPLRANKA